MNDIKFRNVLIIIGFLVLLIALLKLISFALTFLLPIAAVIIIIYVAYMYFRGRRI